MRILGNGFPPPSPLHATPPHAHIFVYIPVKRYPPTHIDAHACTQSSAFISFHRWGRRAFIACGKKLSLKRLVRALMVRYRLPNGSRWKR